MDGRNHVIELQKLDAARQWKPVGRYHAAVNKSSGKEYLSAGAVQSQLQLVFSLRYSCGSMGADGDFGQRTYDAVIKFQKAMGIDVDGVCGSQTWTFLLTK